MEKKRNGRKWKKAAVCALAVAFLLTACGGTAKNSSAGREYEMSSADTAGSASYEPAAAYDSDDEWEEAVEAEEDYYVSEAAATEPAGADGGGSASLEKGAGTEDAAAGSTGQADLKSSNRKIVYTGNISLQTLKYEESSAGIHAKINSYGGFIEAEDTYNEDPYWYYSNRAEKSRTKRNLNITARIPAENFEAFMKDLENDGQVTNTSVNARNISVQYATHDASKKALEIEQKRLLEMMEKAETVEDMIAVEQRLTQVERELNDEKTQLSAMDRDVGFSTVYISLQEVFEYSEKVVEVTYGERLQRAFGRAIDGFVTFWEELILFIVETFPFLIMLGIVIALAVRLLRRRRRRRMEQLMAAGAAAGQAAERQERRGGVFARRRKPEAEKNTNGNPAQKEDPAAGRTEE
ncbi:MAG: DUF4349 domain-containing protein, partial [Eubacteriales bacterium]|nr:DUF4349 domain-containing protein [Eubacteriales bacterium]